MSKHFIRTRILPLLIITSFLIILFYTTTPASQSGSLKATAEKCSESVNTKAAQLESNTADLVRQLENTRAELKQSVASSSLNGCKGRISLLENKLAQLSLEKHEEKMIVLVTTAGVDDLPALREFVGSLHTNRESNLDIHLIIVYGFSLPQKHKREISLWRNVELIDVDQTLFLGHYPVSPRSKDPELKSPAEQMLAIRFSQRVVLGILDMMLRRYELVVYVRVDYSFVKDSVHVVGEGVDRMGFVFAVDSTLKSSEAVVGNDEVDMSSVVLMGFKQGSRAAQIFVGLEVQCLRGYHCDPYLHKELEEEQLRLYTEKHYEIAELDLMKFDPSQAKHYCYLLLRDDVLYAMEYGSQDHKEESRSITDASHAHTIESPTDPFPLPPNTKKIPVAIGMPTLSVSDLTSYQEVSPIRIFFPSLLKTITREEWQKFSYHVYIGFDEGDRYFDNPLERERIDTHLRQMISQHKTFTYGSAFPIDLEIEYVKFPYSRGWVTYIWNGLFVHAMKDGAHYYYQVNDDLDLTSKGWTQFFVTALKQNNELGVAGPWDTRHQGRLLTQAFVSRKHYFIFGRLYPLDIKDWYSDNWLNDVYGDAGRFSVREVSADNRNDKGTRYNVCSSVPRYAEVLARGKEVLRDWLADVERGAGGGRLDMEFVQGVIV